MKTSQDGKNNLGAGVTFEIKVLSKGTGGGSQYRTWIREWGENSQKGFDWVEWMLTFNNGKEEQIRYKEKEYGNRAGGFTSDHIVDKCKTTKIELKDSIVGTGGEKQIKDREIKFWVDENSCEKKENSVTCDLLFRPESKLKWKSGVNPKITYTKSAK